MSAGSTPPVVAAGFSAPICTVWPFQPGWPGVRRVWVPVCATRSAGPTSSDAMSMSLFMACRPLLDRPQIRGDVVHLLVVRIVEDELHRHALVRLIGILHVDLRDTVVARHRLARAVRQGDDDEEVVLADERAFELRSVGHGDGRGAARATAASSTATAERRARAGHPAI